jgi:ribose transport system ATP-binding protein
MNKPGPAIEAVDVARSFGGVRAVTAGNLTAHFGEVHGLVGENGAGKSTLIKILGGVIKPDSGVVCFDGEDVTHSIAAAARTHRVGMVFQELTLFPWMTVAENLFAESEPRGGGAGTTRRAWDRPARTRRLIVARPTADRRDHQRLHARAAHPLPR